MSERDLAVARRMQIMKIVEPYLDKQTRSIVESALLGDERMAVIRDAFLVGNDHEAVYMIRALDPVDGGWALLPSGTGLTEVPIRCTAQVTARPMADFDPKHLLISKSCADFTINEISINNRSQLMSAGDVPADPFVVDAPSLDVLIDTSPSQPLSAQQLLGQPSLPTALFNVRIDRTGSLLLGVRLDLARVEAGREIVLTVTNTGTTAVPFRAAWLGQVSRMKGVPS